jgi:hypothetical protein
MVMAAVIFFCRLFPFPVYAADPGFCIIRRSPKQTSLLNWLFRCRRLIVAGK